jgi:hypothetical protein
LWIGPSSFSLRPPSDYTIEQGARFEVLIERGRRLAGDHARPFEAQLELADGKAAWIVKDAEEAVRTRVAALLAAGLSVREIAEETGTHRSAVQPPQAAARAGGQKSGGRRAGRPGRRPIGEAEAFYARLRRAMGAVSLSAHLGVGQRDSDRNSLCAKELACPGSLG